jgi:hypothetical protein
MTHKKWMKQGTQFHHIYIFWHSNPGRWREIRSIKTLFNEYKSWCVENNETHANEYVWRKKVRECGYENSSANIVNGTVKKRKAVTRKVVMKNTNKNKDISQLVCGYIN